jgi:hypothetical protein
MLLFEGEPLNGDEVSMPATADDIAFVECVRRKVGFGFNASRSTPKAWYQGSRGKVIEL